MTTTQTDRDRFEAGETFVVWGEQCSGLAGLRAYDVERIFDEDGDIAPDFEQFDITLEDAEWLAKKSGSFWWKIQRIMRDELSSKGLIAEDSDRNE